MSKAKLILYQKKVFKNGGILEMKLWWVDGNKHYPDNVRYSLIYVNPNVGIKVLMDNHNPKGHHYHINDEQYEYDFKNIDQLIKDFKSLVNIHGGVKI